MRLLSPIIRSPREMALKRLLILAALLLGSGGLAVGQAGIEPSVLDKLKRLFPAATTFSPKEGEPLHFTAYAADARGAVGARLRLLDHRGGAARARLRRSDRHAGRARPEGRDQRHRHRRSPRA